MSHPVTGFQVASVHSMALHRAYVRRCGREPPQRFGLALRCLVELALDGLNAEGLRTAQGGREWWPSTVRAVFVRSTAAASAEGGVVYPRPPLGRGVTVIRTGAADRREAWTFGWLDCGAVRP